MANRESSIERSERMVHCRRMIRPSSSLVATAGALIVVFAPLTALAQTEDARHAAIRRTMIENAQRAQTAGQFAQCAELAQRAVSLQDTGSLRRLLAECQLSAGMVVDAIGNGELCLSMLRRDERAVGRDVHMAACERVVREGRARTTQLVVRTPAPEPPNLRVTVSGHVLDRVEWNIATIAAAGPLVVEATADGMAPFRRNVDAASGALTEIRVEFAPLASASHGASNGTQSSASHGVDNRTHVRPSDNSGGSSAANSGASLVERPRDSRPIERPAARASVSPWVVAGAVTSGVGVVGVVVGFAAPAALVGAFDARCGVNAPNPQYESCQSEARAGQPTLDALSGVGLASIAVAGVGAAMLVVGLVSGATPAERVRGAAVALVPVIGRSSQEARVTVRW